MANPRRPQDMSYSEAKATRDALEAKIFALGGELKAFPKGPTGLTSDSVKNTPEYQVAKQAYDQVNARLRRFNAEFTKIFAKEIRADRDRRRSGGK